MDARPYNDFLEDFKVLSVVEHLEESFHFVEVHHVENGEEFTAMKELSRVEMFNEVYHIVIEFLRRIFKLFDYRFYSKITYSKHFFFVNEFLSIGLVLLHQQRFMNTVKHIQEELLFFTHGFVFWKFSLLSLISLI